MFRLMHQSTQYLIAGNTEAEPALLNLFSHSPDARIRARVAENHTTPLTTLIRLLHDDHAEVRISLSHNKALPEIFLAQIAADENPDVRLDLAENHSLPKWLLERLSRDDNPYVANQAVRTLARRPAVPRGSSRIAAIA